MTCPIGPRCGLVVSELAFFSDNPCLNPAKVYNLSVKLFLKRTKINKKTPGLVHFFKKTKLNFLNYFRSLWNVDGSLDKCHCRRSQKLVSSKLKLRSWKVKNCRSWNTRILVTILARKFVTSSSQYMHSMNMLEGLMPGTLIAATTPFNRKLGHFGVKYILSIF